jgi:hypothetical protein
VAETKRQRNKIHHVLCEHLIPEQGVFGEIWLAKAEGTIWYGTRDGIIVSLTDVLNAPASAEVVKVRAELAELRAEFKALLDIKEFTDYCAVLRGNVARRKQ